MRIGSQDGVGYDLQSSTYTSAIQWRYNMDLGLQAWLAHYDTPAQRANNVFVNPTYLCQDMVNDYLYTSIPQSQYNNASRLMIFNFPHPASWGYRQSARPIWRSSSLKTDMKTYHSMLLSVCLLVASFGLLRASGRAAGNSRFPVYIRSSLPSLRQTLSPSLFRPNSFIR